MEIRANINEGKAITIKPFFAFVVQIQIMTRNSPGYRHMICNRKAKMDCWNFVPWLGNEAEEIAADLKNYITDWIRNQIPSHSQKSISRLVRLSDPAGTSRFNISSYHKSSWPGCSESLNTNEDWRKKPQIITISYFYHVIFSMISRSLSGPVISYYHILFLHHIFESFSFTFFEEIVNFRINYRDLENCYWNMQNHVRRSCSDADTLNKRMLILLPEEFYTHNFPTLDV